MVFIDLHKELARIKREERAMERQVQKETEKQMRDIWAIDDAKMRREKALRKLEMWRILRKKQSDKQDFDKLMSQSNVENIII